MLKSASSRRWIGGGLLLVALGGAPAIGYGIWKWWNIRQHLAVAELRAPLPAQRSAKDRALLQEELDRIETSGDPLTTAEMFSYYAADKFQERTEHWIAALQPFGTDDFDEARRSLTVSAEEYKDLPSTAAPLEQVDTFLTRYKAELARLDKLAAEGGEVRFPLAFDQGIDCQLLHEAAAHRAAEALRYRFYKQLRAGDHAEAFNTLTTRFAIGEALRDEPLGVSGLMRMVIHGSNVGDIHLFARQPETTWDERGALLDVLTSLDFEDHLVRMLIGERSVFWHQVHHPLNLEGEHFGNTVVSKTGKDVSAIPRAQDSAFGLALYTSAIEAARKPFPQPLGQLLEIEYRLERIEYLPPKERLEYGATILNQIAFHNFCVLTAQSVARRNVVATSLRFQQHYAEKEKWQSIEDLPETNDPMLTDPFTGGKLSFKREGDVRVIYSFAKDFRDDGGRGDITTMEPDIAVSLPETVAPKQAPRNEQGTLE
jgi:hypothetical protein